MLLAAHYDTVPGSPGAGDDGAGTAVVLEVARTLTHSGPRATRNNVVVLLTDAEEPGLQGAQAFVREQAHTLGPTVVLNHEARGVTGAPMTFRMTSPNAELLEALSAAREAFADSATEAAFAAFPNDSDLRHFAAAGMHGYDTALVAGAAHYHSPLDDLASLAPASVQHMGRTSLDLARQLADRDLSRLADAEQHIVTTLPWGLVHFPAAVEAPLAAATLLLAILLVAVLRARRALTLPRATLSAVVAAAVLAAAGLAAAAVWQTALAFDPGQASSVIGEPYRPGPYRVAVLAAAAAVALALLVPARRRLGGPALTAGTLVLLAAGGVVLALAAPGASVVLVPPTLGVATGTAVAGVLPRRCTPAQVMAVVVGLVPAVALLAPAVWSGLDAGLALGGPPSAVLLAVLLLLAVPLADLAWPPRRSGRGRAALVPTALLLTVVLATMAGLIVNRDGATPLRQESLQYAMDAGTGEAFWFSWSPRSPWLGSLLTREPGSLDAVPFSDGSPLAHGPAEPAELPAPELTVVGDQRLAERREVTVQLRSPRGAPTLGLWVDATSAQVRAAEVAGRDVPVRQSRGPWAFGVQYLGATADGVQVRLELEPRDHELVLRVADCTDDLADAPSVEPPTPRAFVTPQVCVSRQQIV